MAFKALTRYLKMSGGEETSRLASQNLIYRHVIRLIREGVD